MADAASRGKLAGDILDPLGIFPHSNGEGTQAVIGYGQNGEYGRLGFGATQAMLMNNYGEGQLGVRQGAAQAAQTGQEAQAGLVGQGKVLTSAGNTYAGNAQQRGQQIISDLRGSGGVNAALLRSAGQQGATALGISAAQARQAGSDAQNAAFNATQAARGDYASATDQARAGVLAAAARPETSLAEAQMRAGLQQAAQDNLSLGATLSRGGNSALAARQATQANARAQSNAAAQSAIIRAQEEAALRNSQIAAASQAGQFGMQGAQGQAGAALQGAGMYGQAGLQGAGMSGQLLQGAGQLLTSATAGAGQLQQSAVGQAGQLNQGLGQLGLGMTGQGLQAQNMGYQTGLAGALGQGNLSQGASQTALDTYARLGMGQANLDAGYATGQVTAQQQQQAQSGALLSGILGALI